MPGDSTVAYANYASVVKSIYDRAWTLPDSIANDDANVKVTVTIASDGTVISARIIERAGDAPVDASVQTHFGSRHLHRAISGRRDGQGTDLHHQLQPQSQTNARMKNYLKICLPVLLAVFAASFAFGQNEITITHDITVVGNTKPIPVSLDGFSGEVADVLKFDLYVQGFAFVAPDAAQYQISGSDRRNVVGSVTDKLRKRRFCRTATPARTCGGRRTPSPMTSCSPSPANKASD